MYYNIDFLKLLPEANWRLVRQVMRRGAGISRMSAEAQEDVAVKSFFCKNAASHAGQMFQSLQYYAAEVSPLYKVPMPIACEGPHVAMTWSEGEPLGRLLLRPFLSKKKRRQLIVSAASWLRWFHERSGIFIGHLETQAVTQRIHHFYGRVDMSRRSDVLVKCLDCLERTAQYVERKRVAIGTIHSDFTPYNLLINGEIVCGIDFQAKPDQLLMTDVSRMLSSLCLHRIWPLSNTDIVKHGGAQEDIEAFVDGYGAELPQHDVLLWLQLAEALRRWASLLAQPQVPLWRRNGIPRAVECRRLSVMANALATALNCQY